MERCSLSDVAALRQVIYSGFPLTMHGWRRSAESCGGIPLTPVLCSGVPLSSYSGVPLSMCVELLAVFCSGSPLSHIAAFR